MSAPPGTARLWAPLALIGLLASGVASACSCARDSVESIFDRYPHAFLARIRSVEDLDQSSISERFRRRDFEPETYGVAATFAVEVPIKGDPGSIERLISGYGGGDCGLGLRPGDLALILTSDGSVSHCRLGRVFRAPDCRLLRLIASMRKRHEDGTTGLAWHKGPPGPYVFNDAVEAALRNGDDPFGVAPEACAEPKAEPEPEHAAISGDCGTIHLR
jgi:hypothetical protein